MTTLLVSKVLSSLPDPLVANTVYFVRVGTGFDIYVVDSTGQIAYKSNASVSPVTPVAVVGGVATVDLALGDYFSLSLTADTTLAFANLPAAGSGRCFSLRVDQDVAGNHALTLPSSMHAIGNSDTAIQPTGSTKIIGSIDDGATVEYAMGKVA